MMVDIPRIPKKYEANYVYSQEPGRLWSLLSNASHIEQLTYNTRIISTFLTEHLRKNVEMSFLIQEITHIDYTKSITWLITIHNTLKPIQLNYTFTITPDTLNNTSLVVLTLYLSNFTPNPSNQQAIIDGCKKVCVEILYGISNFLKNHTDFLYEYESIEIMSPIEKVWDYIIKMKLFKTKRGTTLVMTGDPMKKGTKINWIPIDEDKEIECEVLQVEYDLKKKKWEYNLNFLDGNQKKRAIKFTLIALEDNITFISFFHELYETININRADKLKRKKQNVISFMKQELENDIECI